MRSTCRQHQDARHLNARRRRATVLVMVVVMLSMLFVIGVTFLGSVTFEAAAIDDAKQAQKQSTVIDRLTREVGSALQRGFLGDDGKPFNSEFVNVDVDGNTQMDDPSPIGDDVYGEIPGVHPMFASIEPYLPNLPPGGPNDAKWFFFSSTDLELVLGKQFYGADPTPVAGIPLTMAINDGINPILRGTNLVHVDAQIGDGAGPNANSNNPYFPPPLYFNSDSSNWREFDEGTTFFNVNVAAPPLSGLLELHRRDADGDGVWDSYEYELPKNRFPDSIRGDLAEALRADDFDPNDFPPDTDPNAIYYALRVVPHGGMVDVGYAHQTLLRAVLDRDVIFGPTQTDETLNVAPPYVQEGEENVLRRRFLLPPRRLPLSTLQSHPLAVVPGIPETLYRSFVPTELEWIEFAWDATSSIEPQWWLVDTGNNGDDISQIEFSDVPDPPGWLNWMDPFDTGSGGRYDFRHLITTVSHDDQLMRIGRSVTNPTDDWIQDIVRSGFAANFAIDNWPDQAPDQTNPDDLGPLDGRLKVSLPGLVERLLDPDGDPIGGVGGLDSLPDHDNRDQFIRTIQDAFLLMLRNTTLLLADQENTAAALTANLIDFADSDDAPTRVEVRSGADGTGMDNYVFGLERQPFITEVYRFKPPGGPDAAAIELFNPYGPNTLPLNLSGFRLVLTDVNGDPVLNGPNDPMLNVGLSGVLTPGTYTVFFNGVPFPNMDVDEQIGNGWVPDQTMNVELWRLHPPSGPDPASWIVVDRFSCADFTNQGFNLERSLQRERHSNTAGEGLWSLLIPQVNGSPNHTLGGDNVSNTNLKPVELRFANTGDMATAFPTTGTLLLLSRYANTDTTPFNASLVTLAGTIDNGRMPIFDQTQLAQPVGGPFALSIPWGQLVFDYFTALPMSHQYQYDPDNVDTPEDMTPTVDQNGLRVHGRIDINAAPWSVIAGLPIVPMNSLPASYIDKIESTIYPNGAPDRNAAGSIGASRAQSIVAYREARQMTGTPNFKFGPNHATPGDRWRQDLSGNAHTGFLTVGELANVRRNVGGLGGVDFDIDSGVIDGTPNEDYVKAAALMVAMGDWVTTRSHVFTIYGTLRGAGKKSAVDENAIRFQETVDRLPSLFTNKLPRRVGPRTVGPYAQPDRN